MKKPRNDRRLTEGYRHMFTRRYSSKGRNRNPDVSFTDRVARMLIEKRLPEKVLAVLQGPTLDQKQQRELIQRALFDNYHVSRVFRIKEQDPKKKQVIFRTLYAIIIKVLKERGHVRFTSRTGKPIPSKTQKPVQPTPSYIGVCDVSNSRLAKALVHDFIKHNTNSKRKFMIGVMTNPVVLDPKIPVPKNVRREIRRSFPDRDSIANGFIDNPNVLNTIHYADLYGSKGPRGAQEAPNIPRNLELCVKYGGRNLHAIQLDVTWPKPDELKAFRSRHPTISLVLQVGKFALSACNNDPQKIVNRLRQYGSAVDYILLDMSMGKGRAMASETLIPLLRLIKSKLPNLGLAVAGGLGPEHSKELEKITHEFPNISIDAQGRLKPDFTRRDSSGHLFATDPANVEKTRKYFRHSLAVLDRL